MSVTASATDQYWAMLANELLAKLQQPDTRMQIGTGGWVENSPVAIDTAQTELHSPRLTKTLTDVHKPDDFTVAATARVLAGEAADISEAGLFVDGKLLFVRNFKEVPVQDMDFFDVRITIPFKV